MVSTKQTDKQKQKDSRIMCILGLYVNNQTRTEIPVSNCIYQYTLKEVHPPCTLLRLGCETPSTASCPWTQTLADVNLWTSSKWVLPGDSDSTEWCVLGIIDQSSCLTILSPVSNHGKESSPERKHLTPAAKVDCVFSTWSPNKLIIILLLLDLLSKRQRKWETHNHSSLRIVLKQWL